MTNKSKTLLVQNNVWRKKLSPEMKWFDAVLQDAGLDYELQKGFSAFRIDHRTTDILPELSQHEAMTEGAFVVVHEDGKILNSENLSQIASDSGYTVLLLRPRPCLIGSGQFEIEELKAFFPNGSRVQLADFGVSVTANTLSVQ